MNNRAKSTKGEIMRRISALVMSLLVLVSIGCGGDSKSKTPAAPADAKMLNFSIQDVNGATHDMRQHFGKVVIVDFWDTWCGPCKREIPHFVELYSQYKEQGLEIVGVAFARQGAPAVKQFGEQYKINYTSAIFNQEAQKLFGSPPSIPTTYIIDKTGNVHEKIVGYRDKAYFEQKIKTLLNIS
jgi:thiol-disulfide isomerase/thioredoxin